MAAGAGLQGSRTLYGFSGSASHVHQVSSPARQVPLPAAVYATDHNIAYDDIELDIDIEHTAVRQDLLIVHHPEAAKKARLNTFLK